MLAYGFRQQPLLVLAQREIELPAEIDSFETGGADVPQDVMLDAAPFFAFPAIEDALHMMSHPGHRDVAQQGQRTGYGGEFFAAATASCRDVSVVNGTQESMRRLSAIEDA